MELKKLLFTYREAAELLSVSVAHIRRLVESGQLTRLYIGSSKRSARVTAESLQGYVARKLQENGSYLHPP